MFFGGKSNVITKNSWEKNAWRTLDMTRNCTSLRNEEVRCRSLNTVDKRRRPTKISGQLDLKMPGRFVPEGDLWAIQCLLEKVEQDRMKITWVLLNEIINRSFWSKTFDDSRRVLKGSNLSHPGLHRLLQNDIKRHPPHTRLQNQISY